MDRPAPATPEEIAAYCARIGFEGEPRPDLATLVGLHRAHVDAVPYENFDVLLRRPLTRDPRAAFDKIVRRGRGGWCYEQNGLLGWMLESIGFRVTRVAGAVMREFRGEATVGNHLVLLVDLDQRYVADVGLGCGLVEPVPLQPGPVRQRFMTFALEPLDGPWWRFHNHAGMYPPSFDFSTDPASDALLEERCLWLQTDPASPFTTSAVVQRHFPDRVELSIAGMAIRIGPEGARAERLLGPEQYLSRLSETFGLDLPEAGPLWPQISSVPTPFD